MNNEELEDLLGIGCCEYHIEIGKKAKEEIERLNNIIKEVREYIEDTPKIVKSIHLRNKESNFAFIENEVKNELLQILDKGESND